MNSKLLSLTPNKPLIVEVTEDTQFVLDITDYGQDSKYDVNVKFLTEGVSAEIVTVYKLEKGQNINLTTSASHFVRNTRCMTRTKGVLLDGAESTYIGKIVIDKKGQQTSSFLEDSVLVVGNGTKHRADPILEIEADDVKASHGSTTGRISDSQKYYLMSRGLSGLEAQDLIITGFLESIISTIKDESIKDQIEKKVLG